ncbi:MAG: transglutaminase family protein [Sporichthyaceae bacterium]
MADVVRADRVWHLTHRTEYLYDDDVVASYGRAHLIPRHGDGQQRLTAQVTVEPDAAQLREHSDYFGNRSLYFDVRTPHRRLAVTATSTVAVARGGGHREHLRSMRAREVRERLADRTDLTPELLGARQFTLPSPMVARSPAVDAFAADLVRPGASLDEVLTRLLARIAERFTYVSGSTTIGTTLPELLERGKGVCQDFAHLAVASLRCTGLAARYVSGYLETRPPPGKPKLLGADASHAWVSVFAPELGWVDIDPTNHTFVDDSYVVTAVGRDYADVPPLRGVIFTESAENTMTVSVDMKELPAG